LAFLVDKRLTEINNSMATPTGRVDDIEKHLEELESMGDFEELRGEVQVAVLKLCSGRCQQGGPSSSGI